MLKELEIKCSIEGHDYVGLFCLDQNCKADRVICQQCKSFQDHICHQQQSLKNQNELIEFFQQIQQESEDFISKLSVMVREISEQFSSLKKEIRNKYQFSQQRLQRMNAWKLNSVLNQVIKYDQTVLFDEVKKCSDNLIIQIKRQINELQIEELKQNQQEKYYAEKLYQKGNEINNEGYKLYEEEKYQEAINILNAALNINPKHVDTISKKGIQIITNKSAQCLKMLENYNDAIIQSEKALSIDAKHINSLYTKGIKPDTNLLAESLRMLKEYKDAIIWADKALSIDAKHINSLYTKGIKPDTNLLAESLRMLKEYKDAIIWADKALSIDAKHINSLYTKGIKPDTNLLAESLRMLKEYKDAIIWADKALSIDAKHINSLDTKAQSLRMLQNYKDAIIWAEKAKFMSQINFQQLNELKLYGIKQLLEKIYESENLRKLYSFIRILRNDDFMCLEIVKTLIDNKCFSIKEFLDQKSNEHQNKVCNMTLNLKLDNQLTNIIERVQYYESINKDLFYQSITEAQTYIYLNNNVTQLQQINQNNQNNNQSGELNENNKKLTNNSQNIEKEIQLQKVEQIQLKQGLKLSLIKLDKNQNGDLQYYQYGEQKNNNQQYKKIIFIGQKDEGKTTLLNAFVNYYFGIKFDDNFRLIVANQEPTTQIQQYYLEPQKKPYGINLIDTPGIDGNNNESTLNQVSCFIKQEKQCIDIIVVCIKISETRLTTEAKQILQSIVQIIGKEIKEYAKKIIIARTFYSGTAMDQSILSSLGSPFLEITHLEFNGGSIVNKPTTIASKIYFDKSMEKFFQFENKISQKK